MPGARLHPHYYPVFDKMEWASALFKSKWCLRTYSPSSSFPMFSPSKLASFFLVLVLLSSSVSASQKKCAADPYASPSTDPCNILGYIASNSMTTVALGTPSWHCYMTIFRYTDFINSRIPSHWYISSRQHMEIWYEMDDVNDYWDILCVLI